jgi:hypothetical protein
MTATMRTKAISPHQEASASGVASSITKTPLYMGWRTNAYGPFEMTVCCSVTSTVALVKVIDTKYLEDDIEAQDDE